jgi:hypothetical protein
VRAEIQLALNVLLHESTLEDIEVDTDAAITACTLFVTARPKFGPRQANPFTLRLSDVSRVRVALVNPDGSTPPAGMPEIHIRELNGLIGHSKHRQFGFDFIDSSRNDITRGLAIVDWIGSDTAARHTLTFVYGVQSSKGQSGVLLLRVWFEQFDLRSADASSVDLAAYADVDALAAAGVPIVVVPAGTSEGMSTMPAPISAELVDGALIALLFVDTTTRRTRSRAIGTGVWSGKELKWLSPSRKLYDLPAGKQFDIRPALTEWGQTGDPLGGFAFWTTVEIAQDDPISPHVLVEKYLKPGSEPPRVDS